MVYCNTYRQDTKHAFSGSFLSLICRDLAIKRKKQINIKVNSLRHKGYGGRQTTQWKKNKSIQAEEKRIVKKESSKEDIILLTLIIQDWK